MRLLLPLLLLMALPAHADMQLTRELVAPDKLVPGQPVRVALTFWTDSWFNPPPQWPELPIADGEVLNLPIATQLVTRHEGGKNWSGVRMERLIATSDSGELRLPAEEVTLASTGQAPHTIALSALSRPIRWPKGTRQPDRLLPADGLALTQKIVPHITRSGDNVLRVGDVIDRQVTLEGKGVLPAAIPQLLYAIPGSETQLLPRRNMPIRTPRGDFIGARRVETLRYLPSQPGKVYMPPVKLRWWDNAQQRWRVATLAEKTLTVAPAPAAGKEKMLQAGERTPWPMLAGLLLCLAPLAGGIYLIRQRPGLWIVRLNIRWQRFWQVRPLPGLAPVGRVNKHADRHQNAIFSPRQMRQRIG